MSHLPDAPILKTRHQQQRSKNSHLVVPLLPRQNAHPLPRDSSSSVSPSRRYQPYQPRPVFLRTLRLPQIVKRHANPFSLDSDLASEPREGPHFFNLLPKRAPVTVGEDVFDIDENTSCRELVENYEGNLSAGRARRGCELAVASAREASRDSTTTTRSRPTARTRRVGATEAGTGRIAAVSLTANPTNTAAVESNVSEIFSEAASVISSRSSSRAALATSVSSAFSEAASVISSRRVAATATAAPSRTSSSSSIASSSVIPSTSTATPSSSMVSSTTSSAPSSSSSSNPAGAAKSDNHRVRNIVVPSVVIPIGLLLLFLLGFFCWKKRKRRNDGGARGSLGPISGPRPLRLAAGGYGAAGAGAGAGAAAGAAANRGRTGSHGTMETTPSAIGVAMSEPRSKWGRRSLVEVLAGGVMGGSSGSSNSPTPTRGGGALHSRQESITSSLDRGTGGYSSKGGYRPGMPRPFSPVQAQDPFTELMPTIVPVPPASQRPSSLSSNSDQSVYERSQVSGEGATARLARPITAGYPLYGSASTPGVESRASTEGEQGYWTADTGINSSREGAVHDPYAFGGAGIGESEEEELSPEELAAEAPVNFGSSSSNSSGGSTPVVGGTGTPRLGSGHGSRGYRRGDSNWWG
ncbi:hypothetical protein JCM16303_002021 [Sporobolomyces ruberrimus]